MYLNAPINIDPSEWVLVDTTTGTVLGTESLVMVKTANLPKSMVDEMLEDSNLLDTVVQVTGIPLYDE